MEVATSVHGAGCLSIRSWRKIPVSLRGSQRVAHPPSRFAEGGGEIDFRKEPPSRYCESDSFCRPESGAFACVTVIGACSVKFNTVSDGSLIC